MFQDVKYSLGLFPARMKASVFRRAIHLTFTRGRGFAAKCVINRRTLNSQQRACQEKTSSVGARGHRSWFTCRAESKPTLSFMLHPVVPIKIRVLSVKKDRKAEKKRTFCIVAKKNKKSKSDEGLI